MTAPRPKAAIWAGSSKARPCPNSSRLLSASPKGSISDLVKTQYGFHIIKVLDHESAHTKSFDEVSSTIQPIVLDEMVIYRSQQDL